MYVPLGRVLLIVLQSPMDKQENNLAQFISLTMPCPMKIQTPLLPLNDLQKWQSPVEIVGCGNNSSQRVVVLFLGREKYYLSPSTETTDCNSWFLLWNSASIYRGSIWTQKILPSFSYAKSQGNLPFNRKPLTEEK